MIVIAYRGLLSKPSVCSNDQTTSGDKARDQVPERRMRSMAGREDRKGCAAPDAMCCRVQPALVDAGYCPRGAEGLFCALSVGRDAWADAPLQRGLPAGQAAKGAELNISGPTR